MRTIEDELEFEAATGRGDLMEVRRLLRAAAAEIRKLKRAQRRGEAR